MGKIWPNSDSRRDNKENISQGSYHEANVKTQHDATTTLLHSEDGALRAISNAGLSPNVMLDSIPFFFCL